MDLRRVEVVGRRLEAKPRRFPEKRGIAGEEKRREEKAGVCEREILSLVRRFLRRHLLFVDRVWIRRRGQESLN